MQDKCYAEFRNVAHVPSVVMLSVLTLGAVNLKFSTLSVLMLKVIVLSVAAPSQNQENITKKSFFFVETFKQ